MSILDFSSEKAELATNSLYKKLKVMVRLKHGLMCVSRILKHGRIAHALMDR